MAEGLLSRREIADNVFHGNAALAWDQEKPDSFWQRFPRQFKAIMNVVVAKGDAVAIADSASALKPTDKVRRLLTNAMVNKLFGSILHPPLSYKGPEFQHRAPDGSNNNFLFPDLGKAGLPYAKTVPGVQPMHGAKPDPGDLFDLLMARDDPDTIKEGDLGISSMLLYHADLIIHDIFRTNQVDKNVSDTSSYLDLSPLYGRDRERQEAVRTMSDGLLKPDTFAEDRLLNQPPGVCIYIIMYNRFHNYVARQLKEINENAKFTVTENPPPGWVTPENMKEKTSDTKKAWKEYIEAKVDEELFQTARLITCGLYINISVHDYLRVLMRRHATNTSWTLDPRLEMSTILKKDTISRGYGNQVTVEFNVMYRFHSPLSRRDAGWSKRFIQWQIKKAEDEGKMPKNAISKDDFESGAIPINIMKKMIGAINTNGPTVEQRKKAPYSPEHLYPERLLPNGSWEFFPLNRDPVTGKFKDEELVNEMIQVLQDPICQFGARNTPKFFRSIEILGILQARKWEISSLNEFRSFFGMKPHRTFEDINSNPKISSSLRNLYEHPDLVELYPGLFCEGDDRCLDPGAICPSGDSTALWRAVFSDAVTLVRSDRFYTLDWNTDTLTAWGMAEVMPDFNMVKSSVMHRLFQRAFPGFFRADSIHLWQPFHTPAMNTIFAHDQGLLSGLESTSNLGVPEKDFKQIMTLKRSLFYLKKDGIISSLKKQGLGEYVKVLDDNDFEDLENTRTKIAATYQALPFYKKAFHNGDADADKFLSKLKWKLLRHKVKMQAPRKGPLPTPVSNYNAIKKQFLAKPTIYKNPGYADPTSIPEGPLRHVLCEQSTLRDLFTEVAEKMVTKESEALLFNYIISMANEIRHREQLNLQKLNEHDHVKQIDIIKDYAIPVITRFVADVLGFGHLIKTREQLYRPYEENEIYDHIINCQDWVTFDADETRTYRRREKFRASIKVLQKLTSDAVAESQKMLFEGLRRNYHIVHGDSDDVRKLRQFGVALTQAVTTKLRASNVDKPVEATTAVMLSFALEASHKSVAMFTSVMQTLLRGYPAKNSGMDRKYWRELQALAKSNDLKSTEKITHYILEAQRKEFDIPLIRKYAAQPPQANQANGRANGTRANGPAAAATKAEPFYLTAKDEKEEKNIYQPKDGEVFLLEICKASTQGEADDAPLDLSHKPEDYLVYGRAPGSKFDAKQLTVIAITGLVKHAATLKNLREAHDTKGQVQTALVPQTEVDGKVPEGGKPDVRDSYRRRYLTTRWDQLVPFPTTWNLRFDGVGKGVAPGWDNSQQGHGIADEVN